MRLNEMVAEYVARDIMETLDFYVNQLGFECTGMYPDPEEPTWCELRRGRIAISFRTQEGAGEKPGLQAPVALYFLPDDVIDWWEKLQDQVEVAYPLEDMESGMREFGIRDVNGYLIKFGEVIHYSE